MKKYYQDFCKLMGIKSHPNDYEISLFQKTQKYSRFISWIPGLKMVAVCNSLSMYATKSLTPTLSQREKELKGGIMKGSLDENFYQSYPSNNEKFSLLYPLDKGEFSQYYPSDNGELKGVKKNEFEIKQDENNPPTPLIRGGGEGSDIDLFIITAPNRIWFVRVAVTIIFQLLGVRRHGKKVKDRFCLSFFITENAMDFSKIAIENDIYLYYWIYFLKPIINKDSTYERFIKANKKLGINEINLHGDNKVYQIKSKIVIPECPVGSTLGVKIGIQKNPTMCHSREIGNPEKSLKNNLFFSIFSKILDFKNWIFKKILLPKTLKHKKRLGNPYGIIVSDDMLKFTDNDRRVEIRDGIIKNN